MASERCLYSIRTDTHLVESSFYPVAKLLASLRVVPSISYSRTHLLYYHRTEINMDKLKQMAHGFKDQETG